MQQTPSTFWLARLRAGAIHFVISLGIATVAALLVFVVWYPYPYREISSGRELFLLVVGVDVILGPLITLIVFNRNKPRGELLRDLMCVAVFQLAALAYGMWTVYVARPVHLVFEIDRFRVVHAIDVEPDLLSKTPAGVVALPITGPTLLALRPFENEQERMDATWAALQGVALGSRPDLWAPYETAIPDILRVAKPVSELKARFPTYVNEIDKAIHTAGTSPSGLLYLPLAGRKSFWTVFLDPVSAHVVATMPLDSF